MMRIRVSSALDVLAGMEGLEAETAAVAEGGDARLISRVVSCFKST